MQIEGRLCWDKFSNRSSCEQSRVALSLLISDTGLAIRRLLVILHTCIPNSGSRYCSGRLAISRTNKAKNTCVWWTLQVCRLEYSLYTFFLPTHLFPTSRKRTAKKYTFDKKERERAIKEMQQHWHVIQYPGEREGERETVNKVKVAIHKICTNLVRNNGKCPRLEAVVVVVVVEVAGEAAFEVDGLLQRRRRDPQPYLWFRPPACIKVNRIRREPSWGKLKIRLGRG